MHGENQGRGYDKGKLVDSEERLRILFEYAPDAYYLSDLMGNFVDGNRAAERLTGYSREELIGKSFLKLNLLSLDQIPKAATLLAQNALGKPTGPDEFSLNRKDGSAVFVEIRTYPVKLEGRTLVLGIANDITERKKAEEELRQIHKQVEFILGATKTGLDIIDSEFNMVYIDPEWQKVYGDHVGKKCYEYFAGRNSMCPACGISEALKTKKPVIAEEVLPKEGNRPIRVTTIPFQNEKGEWLVAEVNVDITQQKKTEEELKEGAQRLLTVIEVVEEGITFSDMEGHFEVFNSKMQEITGYTREEANKHGNFLALLYPDPEKRWQASRGIEEVFRRGVSCDIETTIRAKDGTQKTLLVSTSLVRYKNRDMLLSAYRDITKRKQMEEELRKQHGHLEELVKERTEALQKSEEKYRSIVETSQDGIWMIDTKDKMTFVNQRMMDMLGYGADEIMNASLLAFMDEESKAITVDVKSHGSKTTEQHELRFHRKDGSELWALVFMSLMFDKEGRISGVLGTATDITERKKAEEELKKAYDELRELDRMKDEFLATTSHGLKTPVTSIVSLTQLLNEELSGVANREQKEDLATILKESLRLKEMVDDILNMYRLESGIRMEMRDVQLEELIDNALSSMKPRADEKGVELAKELAGKLPKIRASYEDMQEVLMNLVDNALKFTPSGGRVTVGARREGSGIVAWVADTGAGIPESEHAKIFNKFCQVDSRLSRSSGGIGLGLAICKKIIDAHGGSIWMESGSGKGSTFYFRIKAIS